MCSTPRRAFRRVPDIVVRASCAPVRAGPGRQPESGIYVENSAVSFRPRRKLADRPILAASLATGTNLRARLTAPRGQETFLKRRAVHGRSLRSEGASRKLARAAGEW